MHRLLLAAALASTVVACHRAPVATTPMSNKAEPPPLQTVSSDELAYLPLDSELVVGVDGAKLRSSPLWMKFEAQIATAVDAKLGELKTDCGLDPVRTIQAATMGMKGSGSTTTAVVVVRGFEQRVFDCLIGKGQQHAKITKTGAIVVADHGNGDIVAAALLGGNTLVAQTGPGTSAASLDAVIKSGAPLRNSPTFTALFARREPGASVWGMMNGNSPMAAQLASAGIKPRSIDGTLGFTDKVNVALRVTMGSDAEAKTLLDQVKPMQPQIGAMLDRFDARQDGAMLQFDVVASEDQMRQLSGMLGMF